MCKDVACLDADLQFLADVFEPLGACRVVVIENESHLKLRNGMCVLLTV
jgi:hypothetical protein